MLPVKILGLLAAVAAATPVTEAYEWSVDSEPRETYEVIGDETDTAIWAEPGEVGVQAQVVYNCYSSGYSWYENGYNLPVVRACDKLYGGFATGQTKSRCERYDIIQLSRVNFSIKNTVDGRYHEHAHCVDRLHAILKKCRYGGRVNRANWECE